MARKTHRQLTATDVPPHLRGAFSPERWEAILRDDARQERRRKRGRDTTAARRGRR